MESQIQSLKNKSHPIQTQEKKPTVKLTIKNEEIPWSKEVKYLGVTLDQRLNFNSHISNIRNTTKQRANRLYCLIGGKSKLSLANRRRIYTTILQPTMTYACSTWAQANTTKLQTLQNRLTRQIARAPWYVRNEIIHMDLKIEKLKETFKDLTRKTHERIKDHPHDDLRRSIDYNLHDKSKIKRPKTILDQYVE